MSDSTPMAIHCRLSIKWKGGEKECFSHYLEAVKGFCIWKKQRCRQTVCVWAAKCEPMGSDLITVIKIQHFSHFLHCWIHFWFSILEFITKIIEHSVIQNQQREAIWNDKKEEKSWKWLTTAWHISIAKIEKQGFALLTLLVHLVQYWFGARPFSMCQLNRLSHQAVHLVLVTFAAEQTHFRPKIDVMDCPKLMCHSVLGCPVNSPIWSILFRCAVPLYRQLLSAMRMMKNRTRNIYAIEKLKLKKENNDW